TQSEIHDNVAAFWSPAGGLKAGTPMPLHYRLLWTSQQMGDGRLVRFSTTRIGAVGDTRSRLFVLDTSPISGAADSMPEIALEANAGKLENIVLQPNRETGGLRLTFELDPDGARVVELRARLMRGPIAVSESWLFRWTP
ncbi:MAG: opgG, partial [Rubritepida sp.]|nr:opgG [Rubritepida sp.]